MMTKKEALISIINFSLPDSRIEKALIDAGVDGTAIYTKDDEKPVDLSFAGLLFTFITTPDIKEDDVYITLPNRDVLLKVYAAILTKWGLPNPLIRTGKIRGASPW